ncbi:MAG: ABC-type multidrug transport system permease subunit [Candidatus Paceibacteria bacterium]|jgi:ABC-type multidrug transport system permease subunit
MIKKTLTILSLYLVPSFVLAQFNANDGAGPLFQSVSTFINGAVIPVLILLALTYVVYSGVSFIMASGDQAKRNEKKQQIFWGIIGLFVIVSIWGLVAVVGRSFGLFAGGTLS